MVKESLTVLKVTGLEKSFELRKILDNVHFDIKMGERIGLVGYNGTGKTTLANLIMGRLKPDSGTVEYIKECKIGYLTQSIDYEFTNFVEAIVDKKDLLEHTSQLGLEKVYDWEEHRLQHLSGGEKLKLALSLIWSSKPDFLILDEPTNHLDFKGIKWLISELKKFPGPILIISHDRYFLDETINRIFEIENKKLHFYNANYSEFRKEKQKRTEDQLHKYTVQKKKQEEIEGQMEQLKSWSDKAHQNSTKQGRDFGTKEYHRVKAKKRDSQVKSKNKRLQNELNKNKIDKPSEEAVVSFQFEADGKRGKRIIEAKDLTKTYDNRNLFQDAKFYINYGERIGLLGENGCGKTTLLRMVLGQEPPTKGTLWKSQSIKIAYLSQDVHDLQEETTAIDALGFTEREDIFRARTLLANLGLKEELITKPIGTLSLGERTRVKLVDMLMKEYDVLILDEPTNHLDLPSREQLENTLNEFTGTIITVSHDYYFLNKICDKLLVFENHKIKRMEMKPEEYLNKEKSNPNVSIKEELMVIENRLATVLGELSLLDQKHPNYFVLDREFKELIAQKKRLTNQL
ncbi:ABC-F type ribosomal protection protein [Bacillus salipaludis]|uniref:ABC-F type ribosomal protection protein n=1 Tax=Bacillus salipaludis TaxID=2547811 RepID=A0A4R5VMD9_9BACI|nr:ABC-F type ribosomal protection protein [Bacillus salipaludis]TDK59337.1 ABC-F type ribosomal protection protein [Bacillus salipaludis]